MSLKSRVTRKLSCCRADDSVLNADVFSTFEKSAWGQKLSARVSKATTTDFQRYQWAVAKTKKSQAVRKELKKLQKSES